MDVEFASRTVEEWKLVWTRIGAELRLRELLTERDLILSVFPELRTDSAKQTGRQSELIRESPLVNPE